jgi:hypothetical protein
MRRFAWGLTIGFLGLLLGLPARAEPPPQDAANQTAAAKDAQPSLTVIDEAGKTHTVSAVDFSRLPRRKIEANDYSSVKAEFEGASLIEFLESVGVPSFCWKPPMVIASPFRFTRLIRRPRATSCCWPTGGTAIR